MIKRILIVGNGRAGKDVAAAILSSITKLPYAGSISWAVKELVAKALGIHPQIAWDSRHQHREEWYTICCRLRENDPTVLVRRALENGQIVTGARDRTEILAARARNLFDKILWIERPGIPEDFTVTFGPENCDEVIVNDGTLDQFQRTLFRWAEKHGLIPALYLSGKVPPTEDKIRE